MRVATRLEFPPHLLCIATPIIPALHDVWLIRINHVPSSHMDPRPFGWGHPPEIAVDRLPADPDLSRDIGRIHLLGLQGMHPVVDLDRPGVMPLPSRLVAGIARRSLQGRHRASTISLRKWAAVHAAAQVVGDLFEHLPMVTEERFQGFREVLQEMEPIRDLHALRCPARRRVNIAGAAVPGNHCELWLLSEPCRHAVRRTAGQQVNRLVAIEINTDSAVGASFLLGPVVNTDDLGACCLWERRRMQEAQEGAGAGRHLERWAKRAAP